MASILHVFMISFLLLLTSLSALALLAIQADAPPEAVLWTEDFDDGIPATWIVRDHVGSGVVWGDVAASGEGGNYTGGMGDAATASSDHAGETPFDTTLQTPPFDLPAGASAAVTYRANYQNMLHHDTLDLDISIDGGDTWQTLRRWNEDHPPDEIGFRKASGESVAVDLTPYLGMDDLTLRWRYSDRRENAWDWYAQIDDVRVVVRGADLQLAMGGPLAPVRPGQSITCTLRYTNAGPASATGVTLVDRVSPHVVGLHAWGSGVLITPTASVGTAWQVADLAVGAGGQITITGRLTQGLAAGNVITNRAVITGAGAFAPADNTACVTFTVANARPVARDDLVTTNEDAPVTIDVLDNDRDANGDRLTLAGVGQPARGVVQVAGEGVRYTPPVDVAGRETFTYTAVDGGGLADTGRVTVTIDAVNDAPTISPIPEQVTCPGSAVGPIAFTIGDLETPADELTLMATSSNATLAPPGRVAFGGAGVQRSVTITPTEALTGTSVMTVSVDDGAAIASETFTLRVEWARIYLPVAMRRYVRAPDLVIDRLVATSEAVTVTVRNAGPVAVREDFWVDVYVDPDPAPTAANQVWPEVAEEGLVWGVTADVAAGESITLTVDGPHYAPSYSRFAGNLAAVTPVYAQVDSVNMATDYGAVRERHELLGGAYNNIARTVSSR